MPQSLASVYVHLVFSTRGRLPLLSNPSMMSQAHGILGATSNRLGAQVLVVGGTQDHVHLLGALGRTITLAEWVKELKRVSSKELGSEFSWQSGYGAFSVSADGIPVVRRYIETQEEHHRTVSFQDEYRQLLRAHGVEWDERYVWD